MLDRNVRQPLTLARSISSRSAKANIGARFCGLTTIATTNSPNTAPRADDVEMAVRRRVERARVNRARLAQKLTVRS